jgi:hypothetical protein
VVDPTASPLKEGDYGSTGSKVQRFKGSKVQRFKGSKVHWFKG